MRTKLLPILAVAVIAGGVLLWRATRSGDDASDARPATKAAEAETAPRVEPPLPPADPIDEPPASEPAASAAPADDLPEGEEIDPRRGQADPTPREASAPEVRTGGVLKIPNDMSDERLAEILAGYNLVVTRRFNDLVRVGHKDGGDVRSAMDALENDGMFELPDRE